MNFRPDRLTPLLPLLLPAALIGYAVIVTIGGRILRARRKREESAERKRDPRQPWHRWLDEINAHVEEERRSGAVEEWGD